METTVRKKGYNRIILPVFIRAVAGVSLLGLLVVFVGLFVSYPDVTAIPVIATGLIGLGLWFVLSNNPEMIYFVFAATSVLWLIYQSAIRIMNSSAGTISVMMFVPIVIAAFSISSIYYLWGSKLRKIIAGLFFAYEVYKIVIVSVQAGFMAAFSCLLFPIYLFNAIVMMVLFFSTYEEMSVEAVAVRRKDCLKKTSIVIILTGIGLVALALFANHGTEIRTYDKLIKDETAKIIFGVDRWMSRKVSYEADKIGETLIPGICLTILGILSLIITSNIKYKVKTLPEKTNTQEVNSIKVNKKAFAIGGIVALVTIVVVLIVTQIVIPSSKYNTALSEYNAGKYKEAFEQFNAISYKDSDKKAQDALYRYQLELFPSGINVGDKVFWGCYEQDNESSNGKEQIGWLVMSIENNQAVLLSEKALDCKSLNDKDASVEWTESSLFKWANTDFLNAAFSEDHKSILVGSIGDHISILTKNQAESLMNYNDKYMRCIATDFAYANGNKAFSHMIRDDNNYCTWWINGGRSLAENKSLYRTLVVNTSGNISEVVVTHTAVCFRPVITISLNTLGLNIENKSAFDNTEENKQGEKIDISEKQSDEPKLAEDPTPYEDNNPEKTETVSMQKRFEDFKHYVSYFENNLDEYPIVSGDDLQSLIVGSWDTVYSNTNRCIMLYNADGTRKQEGSATANYYWKVDGDCLVISQKADFSSIFNYLQIRDVGEGYYIVNMAVVNRDRMDSTPSEMMIKRQ